VALHRICMHCGLRPCCLLGCFLSRACAVLETMTNHGPSLSQQRARFSRHTRVLGPLPPGNSGANAAGRQPVQFGPLWAGLVAVLYVGFILYRGVRLHWGWRSLRAVVDRPPERQIPSGMRTVAEQCHSRSACNPYPYWCRSKETGQRPWASTIPFWFRPSGPCRTPRRMSSLQCWVINWRTSGGTISF
jgi:hypothetical protein